MEKNKSQKNEEFKNQDIKKELKVRSLTEDVSHQKNKFIKFLIDNKNTEILEKNKDLFSENEIKYIKEKITESKSKK